MIDEVGDLVVTRPMPSMPVCFWGDPDGVRHRAAYFEKFPEIWAHGDWITETAGGTFVVHGRSDATLNRSGVRLGSADIYAALAACSRGSRRLVIGVELPDGGYYMPLFVAARRAHTATDELTARINTTIRAAPRPGTSPTRSSRHPESRSPTAQKKVEVPIKKLFVGHDPATAVNRGALVNPEIVDWYVERSRQFRKALERQPVS